jgi:hypothetical protein
MAVAWASSEGNWAGDGSNELHAFGKPSARRTDPGYECLLPGRRLSMNCRKAMLRWATREARRVSIVQDGFEEFSELVCEDNF